MNIFVLAQTLEILVVASIQMLLGQQVLDMAYFRYHYN